MEIVCALLTFTTIMLSLKKRELLHELSLLEDKVSLLEEELEARKEEELPPLDLSKLVIHT